MFQRAVITDHPVAPAEARALFEYAESNFDSALSQANQFVAALPPAVGQHGRRYGIGVFVFEDEPLGVGSSPATFFEADSLASIRAGA